MNMAELTGEFGRTGNPKETAAESLASEKDGDIKRVNTKDWACSIRYDPVKLFNKVPVKCRTLVVLLLEDSAAS